MFVGELVVLPAEILVFSLQQLQILLNGGDLPRSIHVNGLHLVAETGLQLSALPFQGLDFEGEVTDLIFADSEGINFGLEGQVQPLDFLVHDGELVLVFAE